MGMSFFNLLSTTTYELALYGKAGEEMTVLPLSNLNCYEQYSVEIFFWKGKKDRVDLCASKGD